MPRPYINPDTATVDPERVTDPLLRKFQYRGNTPEGGPYPRLTMNRVLTASVAFLPLVLAVDSIRDFIALPVVFAALVSIGILYGLLWVALGLKKHSSGHGHAILSSGVGKPRTGPSERHSSSIDWLGLLFVIWVASAFLPTFLGVAGRLLVLCGSAAYLADQPANHQLQFFLASEKIDVETRHKWLLFWRTRRRRIKDFAPRRKLTTDEQQRHRRVLRYLRAYRRGFRLLPLWCFCLLILYVCLLMALPNPALARMCFGLLLPAVFLVELVFRPSRGLGPTGRAIQNFFWYGHRSNERDPTLWRSPAGRLAHRRAKYYFVLFLFAVNLLPLGIYYPVSSLATGFQQFIDADSSNTFVGSLSRLEGLKDDGSPILRNGRHPRTWWILPAMFLAVTGHGYFAFATFTAFCVCALLPPLCLWFAVSCLAAPAIAAGNLALEQDGAYEQHPEWTTAAAFAERLRYHEGARHPRPIQLGWLEE